MNVGSEIKQVKADFDNEIIVNSNNINEASSDHMSSILYDTDVNKTQSVIDEIRNSCGKEAYDSCSRCAKFADGAQSTGIKNMSGELSGLSGRIDSAINGELQKVIDDIKTASETVYNEKSQIFTNNTTQIENTKSPFESEYQACLDNIQKAIDKTNEAKSHADDGDKYNELMKEADNYIKSANTNCNTCKGYLKDVKGKNEENRQLLDEFLKAI